GLPKSRGYYEVTEFKLNNKTLPYSPFDPVRWQDVTFEDWSSMSFKVADRPQDIEMFAAGSYPGKEEVYDGKWRIDWRGDVRRYGKSHKRKKPVDSLRDINVTWELSGISGRIWYYYK